MKKKDVYIGNVNYVKGVVYRPTRIEDADPRALDYRSIYSTETELYQHTCPLYKVGQNRYVNIEWLNGLKDYLKLYAYLLNKEESDIILHNYPSCGYKLYVDESSVVPYYEDNLDESISFSKLLDEIILDPRMPRGVDLTNPDTIYIYTRKSSPFKK